MYKFTVTLCSLAVLAATAAFAQTKPAFEVATIKPSPPMDQAKLLAALQAGGKMPIGANIDFLRAEYLYLDLKSLMTYAYGVKPYQITGPRPWRVEHQPVPDDSLQRVQLRHSLWEIRQEPGKRGAASYGDTSTSERS